MILNNRVGAKVVLLMVSIAAASQSVQAQPSSTAYPPPLQTTPVPLPPGVRSPMPTGSPGGWVTEADYPADALRAGQSGTTGFRLEIGADGLVKGCTVTLSSGSASLDTKTCQLLTERARFNPGRDAKGLSAGGTYNNRVRWVLPEKGEVAAPRALTPSSRVMAFFVEKDGEVSNCEMTVDGVLLSAADTAYFCSKAVHFAPFTDASGLAVRRKVTMFSSVTVTDPDAKPKPSAPTSSTTRRKGGR